MLKLLCSQKFHTKKYFLIYCAKEFENHIISQKNIFKLPLDFMTNNDFPSNSKQCEGPMGGFINNEKIDVYKVYRTIVEECGIVQRSCTLLSLDGNFILEYLVAKISRFFSGRIMKHDWEKCDYVLQINPILSPQEKTATMVLHFDEIWKYDLQLFSKYLDKKLAASSHMKSYLYDHKEIGSLINDYVQNILQIKPENIIQFTKHYFLSYAPYLLPRAEYFEQDVNKCFYNEENSNNDNMNI